MFWCFKSKLWFFGQSRQINFDLNFHGKRRMKKALFYLSVCLVFETALDYIQTVLIKMYSLFILCFFPKITIYNKLCEAVFWHKYCCIIYDTMGSSPASELIETFWVVPLSRCFFVSNNYIKIGVYELSCVILVLTTNIMAWTLVRWL